jgi:hypothetical protein
VDELLSYRALGFLFFLAFFTGGTPVSAFVQKSNTS